jgi:carbon monoxide dehydrogenase subunit G
MIMAERKFIIASPQQRIWDLLIKAAFRTMPLEQVNPLNLTKITALLRVKIGFISLPMNVEVEIMDMSPPASMSILINARGMMGLVWLNQKSDLVLAPVGENATEVNGKVNVEGMSIFLRLFLLPAIKKFARDTFYSLEERLKKWA